MFNFQKGFIGSDTNPHFKIFKSLFLFFYVVIVVVVVVVFVIFILFFFLSGTPGQNAGYPIY